MAETRVVGQPSVKEEAFLDVNKEACYALPDEMKPSVCLKEASALARKIGEESGIYAGVEFAYRPQANI